MYIYISIVALSAEVFKKYDVVLVMPNGYHVNPKYMAEIKEGKEYFISIQHIEDFALSLVPSDFKGNIRIESTRMEYFMEKTAKEGNVFVILTYGNTIKAFQTNIYTFAPNHIEVEEFDEYKKARRKYYDKRGTRMNVYNE